MQNTLSNLNVDETANSLAQFQSYKLLPASQILSEIQIGLVLCSLFSPVEKKSSELDMAYFYDRHNKC